MSGSRRRWLYAQLPMESLVRWTLVLLAHSALCGLVESVDYGLEEEAPSVGQRSISLSLLITVWI